jgi:hypothetical protein
MMKLIKAIHGKRAQYETLAKSEFRQFQSLLTIYRLIAKYPVSGLFAISPVMRWSAALINPEVG